MSLAAYTRTTPSAPDVGDARAVVIDGDARDLDVRRVARRQHATRLQVPDARPFRRRHPSRGGRSGGRPRRARGPSWPVNSRSSSPPREHVDRSIPIAHRNGRTIRARRHAEERAIEVGDRRHHRRRHADVPHADVLIAAEGDHHAPVWPMPWRRRSGRRGRPSRTRPPRPSSRSHWWIRPSEPPA